MKPRHVRIDWVRSVWIVGIIMLLGVSGTRVKQVVDRWPKESFEERIKASAVRQGEWYTRNQTAEGDFAYERYAATGDLKPGNSIVRQAGVLYGVGMLYGSTKDPDLKRTLEKGFAYFRTITATESARAHSIRYEDDTLTNTTALLTLGLVEYIEADKTHETTENLEYLARLSNYLVSTQASDSAYINDYTPAVEISDYNNGETMYALIRSYQLTRQDAYLDSVKKFADYAIKNYGSEGFNSSFFSWGMAGFAHLYATVPDERYWQFLRSYADKYMAGRGDAYEQYLNGKSIYPVPPGSAVFIEGVDHIAWIARQKDPALYRTLKAHARRVLEHLLRYEIGGPYGRYSGEKDTVRGALCAQVTCETTRIDFLQHYVVAALLYVRLLM